jgi:hypothetical protein
MNSLIPLKASLLSNGVAISDNVLASYGRPFLEKRRAYGNPDPIEYRNKTIPQELYLLPDRLVVSINVRPESQWLLDYDPNAGYFVTNNSVRCDVTFPMRPTFYDVRMNDGRYVSQLITLYGGGSLGIFVNASCALVDTGVACQYCSIQPNRALDSEFARMVRVADLKEALQIALQDPSAPVRQIMLNGGNFSDLDKGFRYYAALVRCAAEVLRDLRSNVELHLIVFPPKDLSLFSIMKDTGVSISMNLEVFDKTLFRRYCPGKEELGGQEFIISRLEAAVETLGPNRVYSILVGGLEPITSLENGMRRISQSGVTPVINVLHADPDTPLLDHPRPTVDDILRMGASLQTLYREYRFKPFYGHCGRNSLDTEAFLQLF